MKDILNFINGEYVKNASGKTFEKRNPIDNSLIGMVHEAGKPEVDAAVAAARAALKGPWGKLSVIERVKLLDAVAERDQPPLRRLPAGRDRRHRQARSTWPRTSTSRAVRPTSRSSPTRSRTCRRSRSR